MYTKEHLRRYSYFREVFRSSDISNVIDSLTGLVSRQHIVAFIQDLMACNVPFTLALLDLDNFKFINDTYGHRTGDGVLAGVASDLQAYLGDYALAGRYGGDEFLIVNLRDLAYDDIKDFYAGLYSDFRVLRKNIALDHCEPFITGTLGSAVFPNDAQDYASLFALVDKALYRGKTKGRNCYIIYVEEKHGSISMQTLASRGMYAILHDLSRCFDAQTALPDRLRAMLDIISDEMRISDLYWVGRDNHFRSVRTGASLGMVDDLAQLTGDDVYTTNEICHMAQKAPDMHALCLERAFETILILRIGIQDDTFGYLVCAEQRNLRIWQDDEHAIMFFIARMLAMHIQASGEQL